MFCGSALLATTVIPMSVETMAGRANSVVEGRAIQVWSTWDTQQRVVYTVTRFQVSRVLKGASQPAVVVRQLGGSANGITMKVAGVRNWRRGEEAVLFLRPSMANDGTLAVVGLMQGNFHVERTASGEARVSNGISGVQSYDAASRTGGVYQGAGMGLKELETRVQKAVAK
jgi:hypothetical protein